METLRRLRPFLVPYRRRYLFGLTIFAIATGLAVMIPILVGRTFEAVREAAGWERILPFAGTILALIVLRGVFLFRGRYTIIGISRSVEHDLREALYRKLLRLPARFFDRFSTGDISSRLINDIEGVRMVSGIAIQILGGTSLNFVFILIAMFILDPATAALLLLPLALVSLSTALLSRQIYSRSKTAQDRLADLSTLAQENFTGARVVRAFVREEMEEARFAEKSGRYRNANLALARTRGALYGWMTFFIRIAFCIVLLAGGLGIMSGRLQGGDLLTFFLFLFMLVWPVIAMGWVVTLFQRGAACMERLSEILDAEPADPDPPAGGPVPATGAVEVRGLTFRYAEDRPPALSDVTLSIQAGERVAVVGRTGSGKSTLISLMLGFYPVPRGTLFIDGRDIRDYSLGNLRRTISCVPQDIFLFSDPLSRNIAFGAEEKIAPETVRLAAERSRIGEDARGFPDGLDQVIGERGVTLSGGQRQRTALARALVRDPVLLLLDDALSSVDAHTEQKILDALDTDWKNRTCLFITHRFSLVSRVDRIIVMDEGRIVESGSHDELMKRKGPYARLTEHQKLARFISEEGD